MNGSHARRALITGLGAALAALTLAASGGAAAWANFAASGDPASEAVPWPSIDTGSDVLSLATPQTQVETSFATTHHCSFWAAG